VGSEFCPSLYIEIPHSPQAGPAHPKKRKVGCSSNETCDGHQDGQGHSEFPDHEDGHQGLDEGENAEDRKNIAPTVRPARNVINIHFLGGALIFMLGQRPS